jgi:iron complex transport system substrate-binding protein
MRIVSLFPAATEIAFAVGAGDEIVGVSHACDFPPEVKERKAVTKARFDPSEMSSAEIYRQKVETNRKFGSLYRLDETAMWGCQANVMITQGPGDFSLVSLQGARAIAEGLNPRPELMILYPKHLDDVLDDHSRVGFAVGHMGEARELVEDVREKIAAVESAVSGATRRLVSFVQWLDPSFSGGYWIPQLIEIAGGIDALNTAGLAPTRFHWQELRQRDTEVLVFACEDMSVERVRAEMHLFSERPGWWELLAKRLDRVFIGDGSCFTRAGPRLIDGLEALAWAIHPDLFPEPPPEVLQKFGD